MGISRAIGYVSAFNECAGFFQWTASSISYLRSRFSATEEKNIQDEVSQLQIGLQRLKDTLPEKYILIDRAEWRSHDNRVAKHLPNLKDAVYDAEDILDEFRWHQLDVAGKGNETHSAFIEFYKTTIQGRFNKVNAIQERLDYISGQLSAIPKFNEVTRGFDNSVRPVNTSIPTRTEIFGRDKDLQKVIGLLGVPPNNRGGRPKRKRGCTAVNASTSTPASNQVCNQSSVEAIPVLPIVGMGGVGKTTLAQHICTHPQVNSYFDLIIWICADDFVVTRLTKDAIESSSGKMAKLDNLDSLQHALSENLSNKRFLIVVDDVWDDALEQNGQPWKTFCAPFGKIVHGSMMLVTTRSPEVADGVHSMEPFPLHGLADDVLWNFFKLCAFRSKTSDNTPELEQIGKRILPKLKGSPLAAITLGRLLSMYLDEKHWKNILDSELWVLKQEKTDILPALQLSYMYLPFHLKRCFSFCAVYPKDHKFERSHLAEIWVAEGFVEPQGDTPLQDIGCQYFQDLVNRSFFQKVAGSYVIHDLLHDMAQLVSAHDCFIIKSAGDFKNIPPNVRHLYVLPNIDIDSSHLVGLRKHTKLRTLLCKFYVNRKSEDSVIGSWFGALMHMRVLLCASINEIPDSVRNLKHLRYLEITRSCPNLRILPSGLCCLYNLQGFYAERCDIQSVPKDFYKLISLQRFKSRRLYYYPMCKLELDAANGYGGGIGWIKNLNQFSELRIHNLGAISKDEAAEAKLKNKKYLHTLHLDWIGRTPCYPSVTEAAAKLKPNGTNVKHNDTDVFEVMQPPTTSLEHLFISDYRGVSLPSWSQPLENSAISGTFSCFSQHINLNETLESNDAISCTFSCLRDITISGCRNIVSLNEFLDPASVPAIQKIKINDCESLLSVPTGCLGNIHCLEELEVINCPNICSERLVMPYLKRLKVRNSGNLAHNIECCSLIYLDFSSECATSITQEMWSVPALKELSISGCRSLISIGTGGFGVFPPLISLTVSDCAKLSTMDDFLNGEHLPVVEKILIESCYKLLSLPTESFGSCPSLKEFCIKWCGSMNWQRGLVLPSSLQELSFLGCGDISTVVPSCLQNLTSLVSLEIMNCPSITSIPGNVWQSYLPSLKKLIIRYCTNLESIGGEEATAKIGHMDVSDCPKIRNTSRYPSS
ncbi:unnamed protein product [Alopecurus aequalis]